MSAKEIIGGLAVVVGVTSQFLYLWQVFRRTIKPHIFSWFIWGVLGLIGFAAQYASNAGPGSWAIGVSSSICFVIAAAGFFYGEKSITRSDWACFIFSLSAIPVWMATKNPLWAVVIVSTIDAAAFYPTFRQSWMTPHEEGMIAFLLYGLQMVLSLFALESFTLTTALYPAVILVMNVALAVHGCCTGGEVLA